MPYQYKREPLSDKETGHLTGSPIKKNLLITGLPGVGKTTLIKKLSEELKHLHPAGFYTEEIREEGQRKGFELISLNGKRGLLSHKDIKSPYRVGQYKVNIESFENFLDSVPFFGPLNHLIIIDEIGKMECLSDPFKNLLKKIFDSEKLVIATIALKGSGLIAEIKERQDIQLFELNSHNRDILFLEILKGVRDIPPP
jgi:nucleoside-triphosphatase